MKWMEMIRVRSADPKAGHLLSELLDRMQSQAPAGVEFEVYRHATLPGDLGVTVTWHDQAPSSRGSSLGLLLMAELKRCGWVDHSVWVPPGWEVEAAA